MFVRRHRVDTQGGLECDGRARVRESDEHWRESAVCRQGDAEQLFGATAHQNQAKVLCTGCPARIPCLAEALDERIEFGVWGGMTERERRALLRRRPHVSSWKAVLTG
ncbi:WhiB family transcriptional regulator [Streptomyces sp. SID2131]|nr:WhiB family transcriptional regulator [Streptomyces sp. SID2131]